VDIPIWVIPIAYGAAVLAAFVWSANGRARHGSLTRFSNQWWLYRGPLFALLALGAVFVGAVAAAVAALGYAAIREILKAFYPTLALFTAAWAYARFFAKGPRWRWLADSLFPWVAGMGALAVIVESVRLFLPRADWPWLFRIQNAAHTAEGVLKHLEPGRLDLQVPMLLAVFTAGLALPWVAPWLPAFKKGLGIAHKVVAVLAVFTSFTFFGAQQAGDLVQFTKSETYKRVKPDATALAETAIAARLAQDPAAETKMVHDYFDAIEAGVTTEARAKAEVKGEDPDAAAASPDRAKDLVQQRVNELRSALAGSALVAAAGRKVSGALELTVGRPLSADERAKAHDLLLDGVKLLVSHAAGFADDPLTVWLTAHGAPDVPLELVTDLYQEKVTDLAKSIAGPVADAWFRPDTPEARTADERLTALPDGPAFDAAGLPADVAHPKLEDRVREIREEAQHEADAATERENRSEHEPIRVP
jgi:hypothetical protein